MTRVALRAERPDGLRLRALARAHRDVRHVIREGHGLARARVAQGRARRRRTHLAAFQTGLLQTVRRDVDRHAIVPFRRASLFFRAVRLGRDVKALRRARARRREPRKARRADAAVELFGTAADVELESVILLRVAPLRRGPVRDPEPAPHVQLLVELLLLLHAGSGGEVPRRDVVVRGVPRRVVLVLVLVLVLVAAAAQVAARHLLAHRVHVHLRLHLAALHEHLLQDGGGHVHGAPQVRVPGGGQVQLPQQRERPRVPPQQPRGVHDDEPVGHDVQPHHGVGVGYVRRGGAHQARVQSRPEFVRGPAEAQEVLPLLVQAVAGDVHRDEHADAQHGDWEKQLDPKLADANERERVYAGGGHELFIRDAEHVRHPPEHRVGPRPVGAGDGGRAVRLCVCGFGSGFEVRQER